jgi:hypothetical protein
MHQLTRATALTLGVAIGWGALVALAWMPYRDPLTGFGLLGYISCVGFQVVLACVTTLAFSRRVPLLASLVIAFALFLALPLPSKRGFDVRVANATSSEARVTVTRTDSRPAQITLSVAAGQIGRYRSAPGDYSDSIPLVIQHGASRLSVSVADLRRHQVRVTDGQVVLADVQ